MFLDETIDPDIPTDPNEFALYKRYGRNWRNVVMGSTARDRGGNFDRGMRFMHTTPEGFMQRPNMQSMQQVQQSNIDQSGFFAQMQKLQDEYNQALQDYYSYMSTPQYDQMQDYYAGNYRDYYGGGSESQNDPYVGPPAPVLDPPPAAAAGITDTGGSTAMAGGGLSAPALIPTVHRAAQFEPPEMKVSAPAAPTYSNAQTQYQKNVDDGKVKAPAPAAPTMSDQFITRYDRDVQDGKVKTVAPVKTVVKPATSFKKVKAM